MTTVNCNLIIECCAAKDWESLEKNARQVSQGLLTLSAQAKKEKHNQVDHISSYQQKRIWHWQGDRRPKVSLFPLSLPSFDNSNLRSLLTDTNEENRSFGMKTISSILLALDCEILTESEGICSY